MQSELPDYYGHVLEMKVLMQTEGVQFDQLQMDLEDQLNQRFVSTATWGLSDWEKELGIIAPVGQPLSQRRSVVRSKLRGIGKFSGKLLKTVAEAYDNGTVDVTFNPAAGTFEVQFVDTQGIPPNLNDLKAAIDEIIPAHLTVTYEFSYLLISDVHGVMTIGQLMDTPLNMFAGGA